jgi:hypothetical protein
LQVSVGWIRGWEEGGRHLRLISCSSGLPCPNRVWVTDAATVGRSTACRSKSHRFPLLSWPEWMTLLSTVWLSLLPVWCLFKKSSMRWCAQRTFSCCW